mgnify:CR=1 FL=1
MQRVHKTAQKSHHKRSAQRKARVAPKRCFATKAIRNTAVPKQVAKASFVAPSKNFSIPQVTATFPFMQTGRSFRSSAIVRAEASNIKEGHLDFTLVAPNFQPFVNASVYQVDLSTIHGDRGILRGAAPYIGTLRPGVVHVYEDDKTKDPTKFFVPAGVLRIANEGDHALTITASEIIPVADLDGDAARHLLETATAAVAAATDEAVKAQHTITMNVANAILREVESK